ncbi:DoxX family protein [Dysgonomonas sp. 216]|uniref:DoxX family protein n=1 Tax=Dysgonomonas sp. 216 TaxID=2302934 RepID=UPI0013D6745B|nr:DoxX family protein [Dysgonomonas sp. 216]NDW19215.1 DoxX family protein [Dysgonomonas sp. 216]
MKLLDRNIDLGLLVLRLSIGVLMLLHGVNKIFNGIGFIEQQIIDSGLPTIFAYGVYIGEVIAPLLIIGGIATRLASGIFAINCLVAMLMVHSADIFSITPVGGWGVELLGLYLFGALALVFTGGGKYALSKKYIWD